jgi:NADH dehydrogenase
LKQLQNDKIVADDAKTLGDLGIEATSMASILPDYLWCYRPSGQYAAIKNSAKNLKSS